MVATAIESQSEFDKENSQEINGNKIGIKPVKKNTQILQVTRVDWIKIGPKMVRLVQNYTFGQVGQSWSQTGQKY